MTHVHCVCSSAGSHVYEHVTAALIANLEGSYHTLSTAFKESSVVHAVLSMDLLMQSM